MPDEDHEGEVVDKPRRGRAPTHVWDGVANESDPRGPMMQNGLVCDETVGRA